MEPVKVNKEQLLAILKENRKEHRKIFEEAIEGYRVKAIKLLEEDIEYAKNRKMNEFRGTVLLTRPADYTKEYDRAIKMLEMSVDQTIDLEEHDFQCYVMDEWQWQRQFLSSNSVYSATATRKAGGMGY